MLVGLAELIADMGRDAGLDAARADGHEEQSRDEPALRLEGHLQDRGRKIDARQRRVAEAVHHREQHDGAVLAKKRVGDERADHGKKVRAGNKPRHPFARLGVGVVVGRARRSHQVLRHEDGKNRLHAVEREAFCRFVADDEWNARGHAGRFGGGGTVWCIGGV